ncbi:hypothetical protein [Roseovarius ramblicola]|uniref:Uncharacterized protein n=1 Tax=Roseovarius ramblicola TaxID=2022336 RepID=A0ABV5I0F7_9RHOB
MSYIVHQMFGSSDPDKLDEITDKANQLHHLAKIGIAAQENTETMVNSEAAFCALFEVMGRLADEIHTDLFDLDDTTPDFRKAFHVIQAQAETPEVAQ